MTALRLASRRDRCSLCDSRRCYTRIEVLGHGRALVYLACSDHVRELDASVDALHPAVRRRHTVSSQRVTSGSVRPVDLGGGR